MGPVDALCKVCHKPIRVDVTAGQTCKDCKGKQVKDLELEQAAAVNEVARIIGGTRL